MAKRFEPLLREGVPFALVNNGQNMDGRPRFTNKQLKNMVTTAGFLGDQPYIAMGHDGAYGGGQEPSYGSFDPKSFKIKKGVLYATPDFIHEELDDALREGKYRKGSIEVGTVNYYDQDFYDAEGNELNEMTARFIYEYEYEDYFPVYDSEGNQLKLSDVFLEYLHGYAVLGRSTPNYPQSDLVKRLNRAELNSMIQSHSINQYIKDNPIINKIFVFDMVENNIEETSGGFNKMSEKNKKDENLQIEFDSETISKLETENSELKAEVSSTNKKLEELQAAVSKLTKENEGFKVKQTGLLVDAHQQDYNEAVMELNNIKNELNTVTYERDRYKNEKEQFKSLAEQYKTQVEADEFMITAYEHLKNRKITTAQLEIPENVLLNRPQDILLHSGLYKKWCESEENRTGIRYMFNKLQPIPIKNDHKGAKIEEFTVVKENDTYKLEDIINNEYKKECDRLKQDPNSAEASYTYRFIHNKVTKDEKTKRFYLQKYNGIQ